MEITQTVYFDAEGYQLVGTLHIPTVSSFSKPPVLIGCHGLLANRQSPKQISLASACNQIGMAYFRFDHRGCGDSQGEFGKVTSLFARRQDLYHAVQTMQHQSEVGPVTALFGSSFGGTVVMAYASKNPSDKAIISYAAPLNSDSINHSSIWNDLGQTSQKTLLAEALVFNIAYELKTIRNILVMHSQKDETVPVEHARQIHEAVNHPKKLIIFEGGDHQMSTPAHQKQFEKHFIDWILKRS